MTSHKSDRARNCPALRYITTCVDSCCLKFMIHYVISLNHMRYYHIWFRLKFFVWTTSNQATSPTCSWLSLFLSFFLLQVGFNVMIFGCYLYLVGIEISQSTEKLCLGALVTWNCTLSRSAIGWRNGPHFHIYTASDSNQMQLGSSSFTIEPTIFFLGYSHITSYCYCDQCYKQNNIDVQWWWDWRRLTAIKCDR